MVIFKRFIVVCIFSFLETSGLFLILAIIEKTIINIHVYIDFCVNVSFGLI